MRVPNASREVCGRALGDREDDELLLKVIGEAQL